MPKTESRPVARPFAVLGVAAAIAACNGAADPVGDAALDASFGEQGCVVLPLGGPFERQGDVPVPFVAADGSGGVVGLLSDLSVLRVDADAAVDLTRSSEASDFGPDSYVSDIRRLPDGRLLFAGVGSVMADSGVRVDRRGVCNVTLEGAANLTFGAGEFNGATTEGCVQYNDLSALFSTDSAIFLGRMAVVLRKLDLLGQPDLAFGTDGEAIRGLDAPFRDSRVVGIDTNGDGDVLAAVYRDLEGRDAPIVVKVDVSTGAFDEAYIANQGDFPLDHPSLPPSTNGAGNVSYLGLVRTRDGGAVTWGTHGGADSGFIAKLDSAGAPDVSFADAGLFTWPAEDPAITLKVAELDDGVLVALTVSDAGYRIAHISAAGELVGIGAPLFAEDEAEVMQLQGPVLDGKLWWFGAVLRYASDQHEAVVCRAPVSR